MSDSHLRYAFLLAVAMTCLCGVRQALATDLQYQIEYGTGDTFADSSLNYSGYSYTYAVPSSGKRSFMRWSVQIPKGATITSAKLQLHVSYGSPSVGISRMRLVDSDNCPQLSTNPYDLPVSSQYVEWNIATWATGQWYDSPDISALVQEFIDRPGYDYDNYMGIRFELVSGTVKKVTSADANPELAARLIISYTGGETIMKVHMADPEVRLAQRVYCELVNIDPQLRLEARLDGALICSRPAPLTAEEVFVADYRNQTAGQHSLVVQLIDSQEVVRNEMTRNWTTLHNGVPKVGIDEYNSICVEGEPYFPITTFMLTKSRFTFPITSVINTLGGFNCMGYIDGNTPANFADYTNLGAARGWWMMGPIAWSGMNSGNNYWDSDMNVLAQYVAATKNLPTMLAWSWDDEPELGGSACNKAIRHWTEVTHSLDTDHPVQVNFTGYGFTYHETLTTAMKTIYSYNYNKEYHGKQCLMADIVASDYYCYEYASKRPECNLEDSLLAFDRLQEWNRNLPAAMAVLETQDLRGPDHVDLTYPWTPGITPVQLKNLI